MEPESIAVNPEIQDAPKSRKAVIIVSVVVVGVVLLGAVGQYMMTKGAKSDQIVSETQNGTVVIPSESNLATAPTAVIPTIAKGADGQEYLTGELIVAFKPTVSVDDAKRIIAAQGGVIKQHFTNVPVFLVAISEPGVEGVARAVTTYARLDQVEKAEPNYLTAGKAQ